jgi:hypothetical protein
MGLSEKAECACMIEKICLQGKEMLGEISKTSIASAPLPKASAEKSSPGKS